MLGTVLVTLGLLDQADPVALQIRTERVDGIRCVPGLLDAVAHVPFERRALVFPGEPCLPGLLRRADHGHVFLTGNLVVNRRHTGVRHAMREGLPGDLIVVADGGMNMHAVSLAIGVRREPADRVRRHLMAEPIRVVKCCLNVVLVVHRKLVG